MNYSAIHLHFQGASVWNSLPVNIQKGSDVKQFKSLYWRWFRNSARYLYYAKLHRLQKIYNVYQTCEFNVMAVLVYPIWLCTCIPDIYGSIILQCSIELYISYWIDPWFGIETQILMYSACLSLRSTNL